MRPKRGKGWLWGAALGSGLGIVGLAWWMASLPRSQLARDIERSIEVHQETYIGDLSSQVFHRPTCPIAASLPRSYRVLFRSRRAASERGFSPCPRCFP